MRVRDSRLRAFYLRVKAKKGEKTAIVTVARKMLTVIWHLLVKGERYTEDGFEKTLTRRKLPCQESVSLKEMVSVLRRAGYFVSELNG